jgi:hypothetical protein
MTNREYIIQKVYTDLSKIQSTSGYNNSVKVVYKKRPLKPYDNCPNVWYVLDKGVLETKDSSNKLYEVNEKLYLCANITTTNDTNESGKLTDEVEKALSDLQNWVLNYNNVGLDIKEIKRNIPDFNIRIEEREPYPDYSQNRATVTLTINLSYLE